MQILRVCVVALGLVAACDNKEAPPKEAPNANAAVVEAKPAPAPARAAEPAQPAQPAQPAAPADPFAGWTEQRGDGFAVLAPQAPKVQTSQSMATGKPTPTTMYTHYVPDGPGAIQVMFVQLDKTAKPDGKAMFAAMRDAMIKPFGGTIAKQQAITVGKASGEEYWVDGNHPQMGPLHIHVKFILDGTKKRLYLVQGMWSANAAAFGAQADRFVESFKLL